MSLPVVKVNKYNQEIKELGKTIKYRPFLQGEHKILLTAIEFKDEGALVNALVDIVKACTFDAVDMDKLPMHLVDYLFLKIYTKSVGAKTPTVYHCTHLTNKGNAEKVDLQPCNAKFNMHINLDDADLFYPNGYEKNKIIMVDDQVGIKLRAPSFEDYRKIDLTGSFVDITDQFVLSCIESVFDADTVRVPGVDFSPTEMIEWMDKLESHVIDDIGTFFQDLPYLGLTVNVTCPECGNKEVIELKGLEDFFV